MKWEIIRQVGDRAGIGTRFLDPIRPALTEFLVQASLTNHKDRLVVPERPCRMIKTKLRWYRLTLRKASHTPWHL